GLVPTMGALHAGHMALVAASRQRDAATAVSIFVNPTQFGPHEDFDRYPRSLESDCELLRAAGVELVFAPPAGAIYPDGAATFVTVEGLSDRLCGASRPGHFRGVATVVLKLFELARPRRAYFGQKDAAQCAVLRRMVRDFFLPIAMVVCPIVREPDGVAMSSRNLLLTPDQRQAARSLSRGLRRLGEAYAAGERDTAALLAHGRAVITAEPGLRLDYFSAVDGDSLLPLVTAAPDALFAVAAFAGPTRLIDNAHLDSGGNFQM
ncbi:MAG TPA: pantoate--beta-alanine ligase, partial [Terriglobales bacterium]|nr:pantoate--beta-alanine ligase [Terriglobales bacterium]